MIWPKRRPRKSLLFSFNKWRGLYTKPKPSWCLVLLQRVRALGERTPTSLRTPSPSILQPAFPGSQSPMMGSEQLQGLFPTLPLNQLREITLQIGNVSLCSYGPSSYALGAQSPCYKAATGLEYENDSNSGVSDKPRQVSVSAYSLLFRSSKRYRPSLLSSSTPIHLLGQDLLEKY